MLSALCLLPGVLLAQTPTAPAASLGPAVITTETVSVPGCPGEASAGTPVRSAVEVVPAPAEPTGIFSRPAFSDRSSLSWVLGSGPGRFNLIDWEGQPNADRLWWLGRWPSSEEVQLYAQIGFNIHWWAGPVRNGADPVPDLPPRVYDLYLDASWAQRWTERLTSEVRFQPGLYTDFRTTPPDAFRIPGQAVAVFQVIPELFLVGGVEHLQRNDIKVLPVGGVLWQPTPQWEFRLVFPEPKIAVELSSCHHVWGYVAGEYGGGRWTYKDDAGHSERVEYSDFRLAVGIEWRQNWFGKLPLLACSATSFLELGYIFERHLRFAGPAVAFDPEPAWMIRFGHMW